MTTSEHLTERERRVFDAAFAYAVTQPRRLYLDDEALASVGLGDADRAVQLHRLAMEQEQEARGES